MKEIDLIMRELDFERIGDDTQHLVYLKKIKRYVFTEHRLIIFHTTDHSITIDLNYLTMEELQLINKVTKELNW